MATDDPKPEDSDEPDEPDGPTPDDATDDDSPSDSSAVGDPTPDDPMPEGIDEPEAELLPNDPAAGLEPDAPRVPDTSKNDVDPELKRQFWKFVLLFNVALFGMSLGVMLVGFEGRWQLGAAFFAVGAVAFVRGWRGYKDATSDS